MEEPRSIYKKDYDADVVAKKHHKRLTYYAGSLAQYTYLTWGLWEGNYFKFGGYCAV